MPDDNELVPDPEKVGVDLGEEIPTIDTDKERDALRIGLHTAQGINDAHHEAAAGLAADDELAAALAAEARSDGFHAVVEVMGHRQYAGFVSEYTFGGHSFVRVDVPEVEVPDGGTGKKTLRAFTKMFGPGSIYALTPMSETAVRGAVIRLAKVPITKWDLPDEWREFIDRGRLPTPEYDHGDEL